MSDPAAPAQSSNAPDWLRLMEALVRARHTPISGPLRTVQEKHSMLHTDVLMLLYHFARTGRGGILEVGPYLGGSTIAMAWGLRDAEGSGGKPDPARPLVTIEPGGKFPEHPSRPSDDILRDLRRNLAKREAEAWVTLVEGYSWDEKATGPKVRRALKPGSVGLVFLDADGSVERDLSLFGDLLRPDCAVVVDDYLGSELKSGPTREQVDARVAAGTLEPYGIYGWGTWVGRRRAA